jgi:hypothetical protein
MADDPPRRRLGRPTLDPTGAKSAQLAVRLTAADFDRLCQFAQRRRESVPDVVRRSLRRELAAHRSTP